MNVNFSSLANLKLSKQQARKDRPETVGTGNGPEYPYGTTLSLRTEEIKKLGIKFDGLKIGKEVTVVGKAIVTNISENKQQGGNDEKRIELQLTRMAIK